jgi:hypothetical protein
VEKCLIQGGIDDAAWLALALPHIPTDMPEDDAIKLMMTASGGQQHPAVVRDAIARSRIYASLKDTRMNTLPITTVSASTINEIARNRATTIFALVGQSGCGKTHLADALVRSLRIERMPCFPVFLDEVSAGMLSVIAPVVTALIHAATPEYPAIIAGQSYSDVSSFLAEHIAHGSAIVLSSTPCGIDSAETLAAQFSISAQTLAAIPDRTFAVLRHPVA